MEYLKAWAEGKLYVWVNPDNPLRNLSFPPVSKPIPYIYYTREEAEKGGNPEIEEELKNKMPKDITSKYPLVFIQSDSNLGFAGGNNVGIRYALTKNDFDCVILLNNDTVIKRDTISNLVSARLEFGEQAIYGGRIYYYSYPEKIWYDGGKFNEWLGRAIHLNIGKLKTEVKNSQDIKEVNFITFCYVLITKFILEKIGLLDEAYFMYVEDLDYSYRVWKSGYKLYHVVNSEVWHKIGASSGGDDISEFSAYWYYKNSLKFRKKIKGIKKVTSIFFYSITRLVVLFKWLIKKPSIIKMIIKGICKEIV
jgi:GT2 family glycosyltransferase